MLKNLRGFSNTKLAGVLIAIIIVPFVFWGMGSVFSGGNTNSIAKINKHNVSTQDFADFVNNSKISKEIIKENIDNNILEELLTQLVSISLIDLEINKLHKIVLNKDYNFINIYADPSHVALNELFFKELKNFARFNLINFRDIKN